MGGEPIKLTKLRMLWKDRPGREGASPGSYAGPLGGLFVLNLVHSSKILECRRKRHGNKSEILTVVNRGATFK